MEHPCSVRRCKRTTRDSPKFREYSGLQLSIYLCSEHQMMASRYIAEAERQSYAVSRDKVPWKEKPPKLTDQDLLNAAAIRAAVRILKKAGLSSPQLGGALAPGMHQGRLVSRMAINKWERHASRTPADAVPAAARALRITKEQLLDFARQEPTYKVPPRRRRRRDFDRT